MQGPVGFCLALQSTDGDIGTIGQKRGETGYRMVFDREKLKLGQDLSNGNSMPINPPDGGSANPLPATEQQNAPQGHGVPPAVAKKTPSKSSSTSVSLIPYQLHFGKSVNVIELAQSPTRYPPRGQLDNVTELSRVACWCLAQTAAGQFTNKI
ncbi:hypothetical protein Leryth_019151 [Lithospermum erythrorhizon]|nr:hypothetical protein Leryth_019151 [Lithospermum erythrorhizon]